MRGKLESCTAFNYTVIDWSSESGKGAFFFRNSSILHWLYLVLKLSHSNYYTQPKDPSGMIVGVVQGSVFSQY